MIISIILIMKMNHDHLILSFKMRSVTKSFIVPSQVRTDMVIVN